MVVGAVCCGALSVLRGLVCFIYGGGISRVSRWGPGISRLHFFVLNVLVGRGGCVSRLPRRGECGGGVVFVGLAWGIEE